MILVISGHLFNLKKDAFDNLFQQDAHEFLNYLLNTCAYILKAEMKELKELKRIDEQNRLNESLARLNTKTHKQDFEILSPTEHWHPPSICRQV